MTEKTQDEIAGQFVDRPWGSYRILEVGKNFKVKNLTVLPEHRLSLQLHHHRSENWVVVTGLAMVNIGDKEFFIRKGECTFIPMGEKHRLANPGRLPLQVIEVQIGEILSETDIVRFEDDYRSITYQ